MLVVDRARPRARGQPGGARACSRREGMSRAGAVPAARRRRPGARWSHAVERPSPKRLARGRPRRARWSSRPARTRTLRAARALHAHSREPTRAARSSACCSSRTCATCRRAAGRRSWPRWAASRPASRTRSATRWRRSRRPTRCWPRTRPTPAQRQLTRMVTDNVERLKRIVDDVMEVAPGAASGGRRDRRHARRSPRSAANGRSAAGMQLGRAQRAAGRRCRPSRSA